TYAFASSASTAVAENAVAENAVAGTVVTTTAATAAPTTTAAAVTAAPAAATTTVNGAVYSNKFGAVQVQAVFSANGSLSAVNVIQLPTDKTTVGINNRAVPVLNSEALAAQSAHVHSVSGATYTSTDYVKSLQS